MIENTSNSELKKILEDNSKDLFWGILSLLEIAFPHEKGDGSDNEKRFNTIRGKILRSGNDFIRNLEPLLECYVVFKLYEYKRSKNSDMEKVIFDFKNNYVINNPKGEVKNDKGRKDS